MTEETNKKEEQDLYLQAALKAGQIALANGSETAGCDKIMNNILSQSGEEDYDTSVVSTSIFVRLGQKVGMITIKKWGTDLNKLCKASDVSRNLSAGKITIREASEQLNSIDQTRLYSFFVLMIGYVSLITAMAFLNNGTVPDCICAAFCGVVMALADAFFSRIQLHSFAVMMLKGLIVMICAAVAAVILKGRVNADVIVIASFIPLLPGLAMTNSVRDTLQGDYVSGASRLMEATVRIMALILGVLIGMVAMCMIPACMLALMDPADPLVLDGTVKYVAYGIAAFFFSIGFSIIYEVPIRMALVGSVAGCLGKLCFIYLVDQENYSSVLATFFAAALISILAQIFAKCMKAPTIPFLISGIMVLVPGSSLYYSIFRVVFKEYREGAISALNAVLVAGAIAVAIFLVDTVAQMIGRAAGNRAGKKKQA